jgi:hypothetical protein
MPFKPDEGAASSALSLSVTVLLRVVVVPPLMAMDPVGFTVSTVQLRLIIELLFPAGSMARTLNTWAPSDAFM